MTADALPAVPERMAGLPRDDRGYPIFWTAHVREDGTPDFRVLDADRVSRAIRRRLCGMCGQPIRGQTFCFIGCRDDLETRRSTDPAMHEECARYAAAACPFLSGRTRRRSGKPLGPGDSFFLDSNFRRDRAPEVGIFFTRSYDARWRPEIGGFVYARPYKIEWVQGGDS